MESPVWRTSSACRRLELVAGHVKGAHASDCFNTNILNAGVCASEAAAVTQLSHQGPRRDARMLFARQATSGGARFMQPQQQQRWDPHRTGGTFSCTTTTTRSSSTTTTHSSRGSTATGASSSSSSSSCAHAPARHLAPDAFVQGGPANGVPTPASNPPHLGATPGAAPPSSSSSSSSGSEPIFARPAATSAPSTPRRMTATGPMHEGASPFAVAAEQARTAGGAAVGLPTGGPLFAKQAAVSSGAFAREAADGRAGDGAGAAAPDGIDTCHFGTLPPPPVATSAPAAAEKDSPLSPVAALPEGAAATWALPRMNVLELPAAYVVSVELPGVAVEDVRVEMRGSLLVVTGVPGAEEDGAGGAATDVVKPRQPPPPPPPPGVRGIYRLRQRAVGPYRARWQVPADGNTEAVSADFSDGVLCVLVPKFSGGSDGRRRAAAARRS
eukprot:jgi/Mesen1/6194/ME000032S05479